MRGSDPSAARLPEAAPRPRGPSTSPLTQSGVLPGSLSTAVAGLSWQATRELEGASSAGSILARFLNLAEGEGQRALRVFSLIFTVSAALVFLKAVQGGIFLSAYPRTMIPWAFAAAALTIAPLSALLVTGAARMGPVRLAQWTLSGGAIASVLLRILLSAAVPGTPFVVYVVIEAISGLAVIQTWSVVSSTVDARSAKRILPLAGVGASIAWTLGGLLLSQLVSLIGVQGFLLVVPLLFALAILQIRRVARTDLRETPRSTRPPSLLAGWRDGFEFVLQVPLMRLCLLLSVLALLGEQLMEYQLLATARDRYGAQAAIAGFFGRFYGITSAVSLVLQLGLSSRILSRLGATQSLAITPVLTSLFAMFALIAPGFAPIVLMRANDRVLKGALWASAMEQAQTPLPVIRRTQARVLSRGVVAPLAYALTAVILATLLQGADPRLLSLLTMVVVLGMVALVMTRLQRAYVTALRRALDDRKLRLDDAELETHIDRHAAETIAHDLHGEDEGRALLAVELLNYAEPALAVSLLRAGLKHPSAMVRMAVLETLSNHPEAPLAPIATLLRDDPSAEVRRAAIRCLRTAHQAKTLGPVPAAPTHPEAAVLPQYIHDAQNDSDAQVRAESRVLAVLIHDGPASPSGEALVALLSDPEPHVVRTALSVLDARNGESEGILRAVARCLAQPPSLPSSASPTKDQAESDVQVRLAALQAIVCMRARSLLPNLAPLLEDPRTTEAAVTALLSWSSESLDLACQKIAAYRETPAAPSSRSLPEILAGSPSGQGLTRLLAHCDISVRERAIQTLSRHVQSGRLPPLSYITVEPVLLLDIAESFRYLSLLAGVARDDGTPDWDLAAEYAFLGGEIELRFRTVRQRVLRMLSLLHSRSLTSAVEIGLRRTQAGITRPPDKGDKEAQVAELLEMALPLDLARKVVPLFDKLSLRERLLAAEQVELLDHAAIDDPLAFIVGLDDEHLRVCALITYGQRAAARFPELYAKDAALIPVFERMRFLRSVPLFAEIPGEDLRLVAEILDTVEHPAGEVVFRKGETGEDMYIIAQGKVAIRDGTTTIATLGEREFFGELSVIDREARSADAVVVEPAELLRLRAADLGELMARRPQIQEQILLVLVRRLRVLNARVRT
ncbi:MAG: cyclic nucleotide-binding domain-containing protein [Myxococcales bacterium]|nr:cyclic nucleotide-binding domain-containing protein [Myxococcales bacterium]